MGPSAIQVRHAARSKPPKCEPVSEWISAAVRPIDRRRALWLGRAGNVLSSPVDAHERFTVAQLSGARHLQHLAERPPMDLEDLMLFGMPRQRCELGSEEQMND